MEKIVSNTSPLIFLAKCNRLDLAKNLYTKIVISEEVHEEIVSKNSPETEIILSEIGNYIKVLKVQQIKDFLLDKGEQASISLCIQEDIKEFLSDDKKARSYAHSLNIKTSGTISIILNNLKNKKISKIEAKQIINRLMQAGFYISSELYSRILSILE